MKQVQGLHYLPGLPFPSVPYYKRPLHTYTQWNGDVRQMYPLISPELALNNFFSFLSIYVVSFDLVRGKQMNLSVQT